MKYRHFHTHRNTDPAAVDLCERQWERMLFRKEENEGKKKQGGIKASV